ncbi:hypothetical protein V6N12_069830 [Hibiscus sabdariffa]|uniref:Uncharacterized protein n=1 Tax=Hibiscus sabdariffa TaxID=183260 RepID=A0ABR2FF07_9ROSI
MMVELFGNPNSTDLIIRTGRLPNGVVVESYTTGVSGLGVESVHSEGHQMKTMDIETNVPILGDAYVIIEDEGLRSHDPSTEVMVEATTVKSNPRTSFHDIVGGRIVAKQDNIIDSLDAILNDEDARINHSGAFHEISFPTWSNATRQNLNPEGPSAVSKGGSRFNALELLEEKEH